jgi:hypothetical protein
MLNPNSEYIAEIERREKELQKDYLNYEERKVRYELQIKAKEEQYELIGQELRTLEDNLRGLQNKQIKYFTELLKQGIDVRLEGLSWIVKNLIELNVAIDNSIFPKFLDYGQIGYITTISKKGVEIMQLEIMMKCLKSSRLKPKKTYNELSYMSPKKKFKTPKSDPKKESSVDVFSLINFDSLQDEKNVKMSFKNRSILLSKDFHIE